MLKFFKNNFKIFFISYIIIFLLPAQNLSAQTVKLKLIETSDVHGAIFPYDFRDNVEVKNSLAQIYTYIKEERKKPDQEVILLDNGDLLQGQPTVYYYNFIRTDTTHLMAEVMNYMVYDAAAVGNHDIETGHPVYDKFAEEINFPWLAANAVNLSSGEPYFQPYYVIEKGGVKTAVLGLITPGIPNWLPENIYEGIEFEDMIEAARKWIKIIKEKENPQLVIGLFHSGVDYTYGSQDSLTNRNENASKLIAEKVPGFDVVPVGHDHHGWNFELKNIAGEKVLLLGPTSSARNVAAVDVSLTYDTAKGSWTKNLSGELIEMKNFKPDAEFIRRFNNEFNEVLEFVSRPIGEVTSTISPRDALFGNSSFVDLIHRIQLELSGADVSFTAPLAFDSEIKKGIVRVSDMFNLYRYENLLYTMELSGQEIKDYLEYSSSLWFNQMKNADDHLLNFKRDNEGKLIWSERNNSYELAAQFYNFDCAAGINYTVDVSKPAGDRVTITNLSTGVPFDLKTKYKAAVNSYRGTGGGGHLVEGAKIPSEELTKRIINSTERDLRYFLMKWIEEKKVVTPEAFGSWKIIPEEWQRKGKEKDYKILFGK